MAAWLAAATLALTAAATAAAGTASDTASAFTPPGFPRIAGCNVATPYNYTDPVYQAALARQSVTILGTYPGFRPAGRSMNAVVEAIKAKNPNTLVFLYAQSDAIPLKASGDAWAGVRRKLNSMKWWLYSDRELTQPVPSRNSRTFYTINNTPFTPRDPSGLTSVEWLTKYFVEQYLEPNPAVDGLFMDNVFVQPNVDGDWRRTGAVEPHESAQAGSDLRKGYARYVSYVRTLAPGKYQLGNVADWGKWGPSIPAEYVGVLNGGLLEAFIGKSWSVEGWAGWRGMMDQYRRILAAFAEPKLAIFGQWGDPKDYQAMRYGLGSALLADGYYSFTDVSKGYYGVVWFDEYDSNLGPGRTPPSAAWQKGVWRRDFDNGIVLVNPKGNGAQTVTLETPFVRLKGSQDPVTNNGETVTSVTLRDRDGLILLRTPRAD